jgi:two-component system nitrate/nitrite response regulator NarL
MTLPAYARKFDLNKKHIMNNQVKIIIADDNKSCLEGISDFLANEKRYTILAKFSSTTELINYSDLGLVDLILLDIEMPGISGIQTAKWIGHKFRHVKMIAITMHQDKVYLDQLLGAGFRGFVNKTEIAVNIRPVIEKVLSNKFAFPKDIYIRG